MIYAIDFDNTVVKDEYPALGPDVPNALESIRSIVGNGHLVILWTMRSGHELEEAFGWYQDRGIPLFGVNENPSQSAWTASKKAHAHRYIDDLAVGCPLIYEPGYPPYVDWLKVMEIEKKRKERRTQ